MSNDSSHSSIAKFKNEAKQLKKQSQLSLMQAQNVVAKKNGYNSWHDFTQKLKKIFTPKPKYELCEKPEEITSYNINKSPKDGFMHIGQEVNNKLEHWLSWSQARCHINILEEYCSLYSMDLYLAKQAIINEQPVVFISSDTEATKLLINFANSNNRTRIYLFDTTEQLTEFNKYKTHRLSIEHYTVGHLSSFLSRYHFHEDLGSLYKEEFMNFLHLSSAVSIYQKDNENLFLNLSSVEKNGTLESLKKYAILFPNTDPLKNHLLQSIDILSNDSEKKDLFEKHFNEIIKKIKATNLFNVDNNKEYEEINFHTLYNKDVQYPIFIILSNELKLTPELCHEELNTYSQLINITILNYYSNCLWNILGSSIEKRNNHEYIKKSEEDSISFFMRNPPLIRFCYGSIPAQNRAVGASFIFTLNYLPYNPTQKEQELMANANNFFFGKFTHNLTPNQTIKNVFDKKLSESLISQAYHSKEIICSFKSDDIEKLAINEYIIFRRGKFIKTVI